MSAVLSIMRHAATRLDIAADHVHVDNEAAYRASARGLREARATVEELLAALNKAESFISGFEGDEMQEGIGELIAELRAALVKAGAA